MAAMPPNGRISLRVKPGSALERQIKNSAHETVSGALHELAAAHEATEKALTRRGSAGD